MKFANLSFVLCMQMVLDKSSTDDQLLDALKEEIARLKTQLQQQVSSGVGGGGRASNDGISSRFGGGSTMGNSTVRVSAVGVGNNNSSNRTMGTMGSLGQAGSAVAGVVDSLDFLQAQQQMQTEQWEAEQRQMQTELQRLRRLCKNQVYMAWILLLYLYISLLYSYVQ